MQVQIFLHLFLVCNKAEKFTIFDRELVVHRKFWSFIEKGLTAGKPLDYNWRHKEVSGKPDIEMVSGGECEL